MEVVEFGPLTDAYRAELEGDEVDPFDAAGNSLQWRGKDRHVALLGADGRLVASVGLVLAEVRVGDDRIVPVVGIGGVIVTAAHRGRGLAREVLGAALARAATLGPPLVLLFCLPDRVGLYERCGFAEVARPVVVQQPEGLAEMPLITMWRALAPGGELPDGPVTLLGLPF
jgi:predicted N-acetyltransferase YhbS